LAFLRISENFTSVALKVENIERAIVALILYTGPRALSEVRGDSPSHFFFKPYLK